jgi:hypothetical protein
MRTPKPSFVDVVLLLILMAGILGLAFGTSRLQAAGVIAVVLSLGVSIAVRPRGRAARSPASRYRRADKVDVTSRGG